MMNSPLKGIERISEELRLERQKANNALQDRARLRVEIEGLKQTVDQQVDEINQYRELYNNAHLENEQLKKQLHEEGGEQELMHEEMINLRQEMEVFNNTKQQLMDENEALLEKQKEKDTLIAAMQVKLESYETRTSSKDELINNMKNDIQQIRKQQLSAEQEKMELSSLLAQQTAINEELKVRKHITPLSTQ